MQPENLTFITYHLLSCFTEYVFITCIVIVILLLLFIIIILLLLSLLLL